MKALSEHYYSVCDPQPQPQPCLKHYITITSQTVVKNDQAYSRTSRSGQSLVIERALDITVLVILGHGLHRPEHNHAYIHVS